MTTQNVIPFLARNRDDIFNAIQALGNHILTWEDKSSYRGFVIVAAKVEHTNFIPCFGPKSG